MKKLLISLLALCVILPACGGDDGGSNAAEQALVDGLAASLSSDPEFPFPDEAPCITESLAGEIGFDRLVELGITEDSGNDGFEVLPAEIQAGFINGIFDCVGKSGLATLLVQASNEEPDDGPPLRMEDAECIAEGLSNEQWTNFLQGAFSGQELTEAAEADFFLQIIESCPQILVNTFKDDLGLDDSQAECLAEALTGTLINLFTSGDLENGDAPPEVFGELIEALVGCGIDISQLE